jgi:hypothetical protein
MNLQNRKLDTIGTLRIPKVMTTMTTDQEGYAYSRTLTNPMPVTDDWALLPDGTVAFLRGRDYRIDWLSPDGSWSSSPKLPYDWQRLTDDGKREVIDSVRTKMQQDRATNYYFTVLNWANQYAQPFPDDFKLPDDLIVPPGIPANMRLPSGTKLPPGYETGPVQSMFPGAPNGVTANQILGRPDTVRAPANAPGNPPGAGNAPAAAAAAASGGRGMVPLAASQAPPMPTPASTGTQQPIVLFPPEELPDYRPAFTAGAVRADADGRLWIRATQPKPVAGGIVYDIVSRSGEIVDRLQIPTGHTLVGFAPGGIVYLWVRDATGVHLEQVRLNPR